jgi:hypothetical protein
LPALSLIFDWVKTTGADASAALAIRARAAPRRRIEPERFRI